jgi:hypothetical protein
VVCVGTRPRGDVVSVTSNDVVVASTTVDDVIEGSIVDVVVDNEV